MDALGQTTIPYAVGNTLGGMVTKVGEAFSSLSSCFGKNLPFSKGAASALPADGSQDAAENARFARQNQLLADAELERVLNNNPTTAPLSDAEMQQLIDDAITKDVNAAELNRLMKYSLAEDTSHKITLTPSDDKWQPVVFENMPEVFESRAVEYEPVTPPQSPGAFQKFRGTSPTTWTLNATLTSRTTTEATLNLGILNRLRAWCMPYYGEGTAQWQKDRLGAPPVIITLQGWRRRMVGPVQTVITGLNWTFPGDVDYIPASDPGEGSQSFADIPFPTVVKVTINLVETYSADRLSNFDLYAFGLGEFGNAFKPGKVNDNPPGAVTSASGAGSGQPPAAASVTGAAAPVLTTPDIKNIPPVDFKGLKTYDAGAGRGWLGGPQAHELELNSAGSVKQPGAAVDQLKKVRRGGTPAEIRRVIAPMGPQDMAREWNSKKWSDIFGGSK